MCETPENLPLLLFSHRPWALSSSPRSSCSVKPSRTCRGPRHAPIPWPASSRSTALTSSARRQSCTSSTSASTTSASRSTTGEAAGQQSRDIGCGVGTTLEMEEAQHHAGKEELQKGLQGGLRRKRLLACAGWVELGKQGFSSLSTEVSREQLTTLAQIYIFREQGKRAG